MRNFILFIRRFFNLILFLGLQVLCIVLLTRTRNMMQGNAFLSSANTAIGYVYNRQNAVQEYFRLGRLNESLLEENKRLRQELAQYQSSDTLSNQKVVRTFTEKDSSHIIHYAQYTYYQARVINNSISNVDNYLTINRGAKDGIRKYMPVISGTGVVGRVANVSDHFATVLSILNTNKFKVSARLQDGTTSSVSWDNGMRPDEMLMTGIAQEKKVKIGDSVFTTSYSTLFPRDLLIGTVTKMKAQPKDNSRILTIRPATNFRNVQYVYVIQDDFIDERRQLEDSTTKKKK